MNWFNKLKFLKIAIPLPPFEYKQEDIEKGIHTNLPFGFKEVRDEMTAEDAKKQQEKYPNLVYEGAGRCGVAFKHNDNVIVKLTSDSSEYMTALEILGLQKRYDRVPGFVKVFCAEELRNGVYSIALEKVKTLNGEEKKIVEILYHLETLIYDQNFSDKQLFKLLEVKYKIKTHTRFFQKIYKKYKDLILNIKEMGGNTDDCHEDNIGVLKNGEYAMFDLGGIF